MNYKRFTDTGSKRRLTPENISLNDSRGAAQPVKSGLTDSSYKRIGSKSLNYLEISRIGIPRMDTHTL